MVSASRPEQYAAHPVPSLDEWHELWAQWDLITRQMIPDEELLEKPIKLRNACIFYLGHIPTFFDMKLTEATNGKPTEPSTYTLQLSIRLDYHMIYFRARDPQYTSRTDTDSRLQSTFTTSSKEVLIQMSTTLSRFTRTVKCLTNGQPWTRFSPSRSGFENV